MTNLVIVVGCLVLGVALSRARVLPADAPATLNAWVLYIALPALVVAKLGALRPGWDALVPGAMAWVQIALVAAAVAVIGPILGWDRRLRATVTLAAGLGNTSFVGLPLVRALLGDDAVPTAILADQLGTFLAFSTVGLAIADWGAGTPIRLGPLVSRVARFPAVWALLAAFLLPVPAVIRDALDGVGATLTPLALVSVGLQLRLRGTGDATPVAVGLALKLVIAPALILALYLACGVHGRTLEVTLLEAAMAPMTTAAIIAVERDLSVDVATRLVGLGIPLSLLTVPAWAGALHWLQGPR